MFSQLLLLAVSIGLAQSSYYSCYVSGPPMSVINDVYICSKMFKTALTNLGASYGQCMGAYYSDNPPATQFMPFTISGPLSNDQVTAAMQAVANAVGAGWNTSPTGLLEGDATQAGAAGTVNCQVDATGNFVSYPDSNPKFCVVGSDSQFSSISAPGGTGAPTGAPAPASTAAPTGAPAPASTAAPTGAPAPASTAAPTGAPAPATTAAPTPSSGGGNAPSGGNPVYYNCYVAGPAVSFNGDICPVVFKNLLTNNLYPLAGVQMNASGSVDPKIMPAINLNFNLYSVCSTSHSNPSFQQKVQRATAFTIIGPLTDDQVKKAMSDLQSELSKHWGAYGATAAKNPANLDSHKLPLKGYGLLETTQLLIGDPGLLPYPDVLCETAQGGPQLFKQYTAADCDVSTNLAWWSLDNNGYLPTVAPTGPTGPTQPTPPTPAGGTSSYCPKTQLADRGNVAACNKKLGTSVSLDNMRNSDLKQHNALRTWHHASNLALDNDLDDYAQCWAEWLATNHGDLMAWMKQPGYVSPHRQGNPNIPDVGQWPKSPGVGENIAWQMSSAGYKYNGTAASDGWYAEVANYDWANPGNAIPGAKINNGEIGHFTQLVWKASSSVGFGYSWDTTCNNFYAVGNYGPQGNVGSKYGDNVAAH